MACANNRRRVLDAAQREPVIIRRQNRDVAVLLSPQDYERLRALNAMDFQQFCDRVAEKAAARGMTEENSAKFSPMASSAAFQVMTRAEDPHALIFGAFQRF